VRMLRTPATLAAMIIGVAVALGLAWLGSNLVDERLTPAARALLAPHTDPFAPSENIFVALAGFTAPSGRSMMEVGVARIEAGEQARERPGDPSALAERDGVSQGADLTFKGGLKSWLWRTSSVWQAAKSQRTQIAALIAANQELYRRYLGMHELPGYFDFTPPGNFAPDVFFAPLEVQKLFLTEVADRLQTGTLAQQQAAFADLRRDIRMWKVVLDGSGGLLSKMIAALSLHQDFLVLGDMVTDPDFPAARLGDGLGSLAAPFPLQEWKIGGAYGWDMRKFASFLPAFARANTPAGPAAAPPVEWWGRADGRLSAQFFKLNATENLQADLMQRLSALADGDPGSFLERRDAYRKWESHEFPVRISWYNPIGRVLVAIGAGASYDDDPARVFDIAAFQRLVFLAYQIRQRGIGFRDIPAFMKQHPQWSTHPIDARPFYWSPAEGTLGVRPIGYEAARARFSLKLVEIAASQPPH
jgi:hypothetical protein